MISLALVAAMDVPPARPAPPPAMCVGVRVIDADTFVADCDGLSITVRLADIDAPEASEPCPAARLIRNTGAAMLDQWVAGYQVEISTRYFDRYGRAVADVVTVDDVGEPVAIGALMLAAGKAQPWPHDARGRALADKPDWCAATTDGEGDQ